MVLPFRGVGLNEKGDHSAVGWRAQYRTGQWT